MDLVDLNGMWPSLKDIGKGIKNAASSVGEFVSDHQDTIATVASVAIAAAVIAGCVVAAPVAGAVIAGAAVGGTIGGISEVASQIATEGKVTSVKKVIISTAGGAASGALTGGTASVATSVAGNMALSAGGSVAKDTVSISNGENISRKDMVINGGIGALSGKIGGSGAQYNKFKSTTADLILYNGEKILDISTRSVWREYTKYYTDSIAKAIAKGFGYGIRMARSAF